MSADDSLESVMARYVAGDLQAFDELYARVRPRVYKYLLSMSRNRARAEDLFQTTFLKLHRGRHGWIPGAEVMPWVMAIARNAFLDEVNRERRAPVRLTTTGDEFELVNLAAIGGEHGQETTEGGHQIAEALASAVAALPENYREALFLTKQSGLTHAQAAQVLGTTETAVKLRVHRAYGALRAALRKYREPEQ